MSRLVVPTLALVMLLACTSFESTDAPAPATDAGSDVASPQPDSGANDSAASDAPIEASTPSSNYAATILADMPEGYWRFTEALGSPGLKSAINGHALLDGNTKPTYGLPGLFGGAVGAIGLDGHAERVFSNTVPTRFPQSFAIEVWIFLTEPLDGNVRGLAAQSDGTSSFYFYLYEQGVLLETVSNEDHAYAYAPPLATNVWHHVVVQASSALEPDVFVDGEQKSRTTGTQTVLATRAFNVGAVDDSSLAIGPGAKIAELALYHHLLTPAQITAHILAGKTQ